ncbi:hypothetical protein TSUD_01840 [Trifolium subterraneum]|nr:hypothetical protein TSUD_01840 [Trifolium subterraneum]
MDEVDVEPESEGFPQPEASSKDSLHIDFQQNESVAHKDDTSQAAVNDADDDFANFHHQLVDVLSVDPATISLVVPNSHLVRVVALLILHLPDYFVEGSATSILIYHGPQSEQLVFAYQGVREFGDIEKANTKFEVTCLGMGSYADIVTSKIFKDMFVYVGMYNEDVGRQVSAHLDISRNNSKVLALESISLESINNLATFVVAKIEGTPYELVKFDVNATNNLVPREFYHCQFYNLSGTVVGKILKEYWLKTPGEYNDYNYATFNLRNGRGNLQHFLVVVIVDV